MTASETISQGTKWNSCRSCTLRSFCLAAGLDGGQLEKFEAGRGNVRILHGGQHLYRAGEQFRALYVVRSGMVKAMVTTEDGEEQVTGFYLPGEVLGIDGIGGDRHASSVEALETSSVCILPFRSLVSLGRELPALQQQLWRQTGREIATRQELLLAMGHKDSEARLAGFLVSLSARFQRIGYSPSTFYLPMGRHDIGNYLGMTLETVSRVLSRFEKAGLISKDRRNICLRDIPGLAATCQSARPAEAAAKLPNRAGRTAQGVPARRRAAGDYAAAAA